MIYKDPCPYCHRPLTLEVIAEKKQRKIDNARASTLKRKNSGNKGGRKKIRDDGEIKRLRATGLSIRDIASRIGLSTTAVQRGLK